MQPDSVVKRACSGRAAGVQQSQSFSRTSSPLIEQMEAGGMKMPKHLAYDRGDRSAKEVRGVEVITPGKPQKRDSAYDRYKKRHPFRHRAGIEPLIGHLKYDHRMLENYLWRASGTINAMLAAPSGISRN